MKLSAESKHAVASEHLPPIESSLLLTRGKKGKPTAVDKLEMPTDEWGVPQPRAYLEQLASTLSKDYIPPKRCNIHHLVYPRTLYHAPGRDSIEYRFRESPALMVSMPVQVHNYGHAVMVEPAMPPKEVMTQWVKEKEQVNQLYSIGRTVLATSRWLDDAFGSGHVTYRTAKTYAKERGLDSPDVFYDMLDSCEDGQVGLMPKKSVLGALGIAEATRQLGVLAGAKSLSLHRFSLKLIKQHGIDGPSET